MPSRHLVAEPLSAERFRPYGQVIGAPDLATGRSIGTGLYWPAALPAPEQPLDVAMIRYPPRPFEIVRMERHRRSGQTFLPLAHTPTVLVVARGHNPADPDEWPDLDALVAFLVPPHMGVRLERGTWHVSPFPLVEPAVFAVLAAPRTIEDDSDWRTLPAPLRLTFALADP
jgi:ureidoglycolate lyase